MPQLNPTPWFTMMLITWMFLLLMMTKISNFSPVSTPTTHDQKTAKPTWTWPWP